MTQAPGARPPAVRVLVADDDRLVRAGVVGILEAGCDIRVVAQAGDGHEAVELVAAHRLDVVLLDIQMPSADGLVALRAVHRAAPDLPVGMLTTFSDEDYLEAAIDGGALGFLLKSDEPELLVAGVRALAQGGGAFSPRVARWLATRERSGRRTDRAQDRIREVLTPRQLELLLLIGQGLSNPQIATALHLSEGTVKQYVSALFDALGVENRVRAAVLAHRAGLLP